MNQLRNKGFTLIELLIVVAIIAILAAIAIPNFLAAQTRSKVARVKANMRTSVTAIEAFKVDNSEYPHTGGSISANGLPNCVTTPVAYMTRVPDDMFDVFKGYGAGFLPIKYRSETYNGLYVNTGNGNWQQDVHVTAANTNPTNVRYVVFSLGPGQQMAHRIFGTGFWNLPGESGRWPHPYRYWYDPTNGTISLGYVVRDSRSMGSP